MSRGKNNASSLVSSNNHHHQHHQNHHNNASGNAPSAQAQGIRRGNKTLAWYISDKILDKNDSEGRESASPFMAKQLNNQNRKNSMDSQSSANSLSKSQANHGIDQAEHEDRNRRNKKDRRQARPRSSRRNASGLDNNLAAMGKDSYDEKDENVQPHDYKSLNGMANNASNSFMSKDRKEDYWYFDPVSDGFYYEFNGSRGWRKRNPKRHGPGGVPLAQNVNGVNAPAPLKVIAEAPEQMQQQQHHHHQQSKPMAVPQAAQQQPQQQQTSKFFPNATASAQPPLPNIKYYDAASDGFFYEMASVDGWKRRQPGAIGTSPPNNPATQSSSSLSGLQSSSSCSVNGSSSAAGSQGRIFRPMHLQQQQQAMGRPFPPTSASPAPQGTIPQRHLVGSGAGTMRGFGAGQQQGSSAFSSASAAVAAQMQRRQNLTNAELEDMIVQSRSVPMNMSQVIQNNNRREDAYAYTSPSSNPMSFASAVANNDHHHHKLHKYNGIPSTDELMMCQAYNNTHSSSSTTISSSLSDTEHCSPPPSGFCGKQSYQINEYSLAHQKQHNGGGVPWGKSRKLAGGMTNGMDICAQNPQTKQPTIGSFEEPYEFYWSDNDKNSMSSNTLEKAASVSSTDEIAPNQRQQHQQQQQALHPSLAAYLTELTIQEQYNEQLEQQLKQFTKPKELQKTQGIQLKRPNTLRLQTQLPRSSESNQDPYHHASARTFNVDQFIADLPPMVDHEKMLHTLSALRTPMVEANTPRIREASGMYFDMPSTHDSPLFTPFFFKNNGNVEGGNKTSWNGQQQASKMVVLPGGCSSVNGTKSAAAAVAAASGANALEEATSIATVIAPRMDLKEIEKIWSSSESWKCPAF